MRYFILFFQVDVLRKLHEQIRVRCNHLFYDVQERSELIPVFFKLTRMPMIFVRRPGAVEKVLDAVKFCHKRNFRATFLNETVFAPQCLLTSHERHSNIGIKTNGCWCANRTFVKLSEVDIATKTTKSVFGQICMLCACREGRRPAQGLVMP
jgi:hypothetical protein